MLSVLAPGLLSTVQDQGRAGWQRFGISAGGAMDIQAAVWANRIVGNVESAAVLEITLAGPTLSLNDGHWLALAGADCGALLNGRPLPCGSLAWAPAGSELKLGAIRHGCRSYLAVAGGFAVAEVMGSRSTALRAGFGGWQGRALLAGAELAAMPGSLPVPAKPERLWISRWRLRSACYMAPVEHDLPRVLRLIPGGELPEAALEALTAQVLQVSPQSDRMGLRLQGQAIARPPQDLRLSAGLAFGSVQLPPDGQPIILAADRQSTGGYPLLGTVATVDHGLVAQLRPGERVAFTVISLEEAHRALRARQVLEARALWQLR